MLDIATAPIQQYPLAECAAGPFEVKPTPTDGLSRIYCRRRPHSLAARMELERMYDVLWDEGPHMDPHGCLYYEAFDLF